MFVVLAPKPSAATMVASLDLVVVAAPLRAAEAAAEAADRRNLPRRTIR